MTASLEMLVEQEKITGFREEMIEKVFRLIKILSTLMDQSFLKEKLVLKGGTALNLFHFGLPRLSIDIDFNYIGSINRDEMLNERKKIEILLLNLLQREGYTIRRSPVEHAGGKMILRYNTVTNQTGLLEIDLNYIMRLPLWPIASNNSFSFGTYQATMIPTLDIHELMAGKLSALFSRNAGRDLFDMHYFFNHYDKNIDIKRLRLAFIVYGAINRKDWRTISIKDISFTENELKKQLIPVLPRNLIQKINSFSQWTNRMIEECRNSIAEYLLPLKEHEIEFLNQVNDRGQIHADLLTNDNDLIQKIKVHPGLQWKTHNVVKFKKEI